MIVVMCFANIHHSSIPLQTLVFMRFANTKSSEKDLMESQLWIQLPYENKGFYVSARKR